MFGAGSLCSWTDPEQSTSQTGSMGPQPATQDKPSFTHVQVSVASLFTPQLCHAGSSEEFVVVTNCVLLFCQICVFSKPCIRMKHLPPYNLPKATWVWLTFWLTFRGFLLRCTLILCILCAKYLLELKEYNFYFVVKIQWGNNIRISKWHNKKYKKLCQVKQM